MSQNKSSLSRKYFFTRLKKFSLSRLWGLAKNAQKYSKKPKLWLMADMAFCMLKYELAFQDYVEWDIHQLKAAERRTWMTAPKSNRISQIYNDKSEQAKLSNKTL